MLVIYHSRCSVLARLAAALHVGWLPPDAPAGEEALAGALERIGGASALSAEGLWPVGVDARGRQVFALGRASRPDVVHRAFHAMAELAGVSTRTFLLQNVGATIAWTDIKARVLGWLGLEGRVQPLLRQAVRAGWPVAGRAVANLSQVPFTRPLPHLPERGRGGPLRIIYYCYGAAHSSVTAANLHVGNLPLERRPHPSEIMHQPLFDATHDYEIGFLHDMGQDEANNRIYILGLAGGGAVMRQALQDFLGLCGLDIGRIRFEDTLPHAGMSLRIGGYMSRRLGLVWLGRPLCALGVWIRYWSFAGHVRRVRAETGAVASP